MVKNRASGLTMDDVDDFGFFKILQQTDSSSESLRGFPLKFIRSISSEEIKDVTVLKLSCGKSWRIRVCSNQIFYFMEKHGWDKFVSDNGLGNDEVLTFTHKGNMCFHVDIYRKDSEKLLPLSNSGTAVGSSSGRNKRGQRKNIYKDVKSEETESLNLGLETAESSRRGQRLSLRKKKYEKAKKKVGTAYNDSEDNRLSLGPEFTITIRSSYLIYMGVPKKFEKMHMPKETTSFKIHDEEGGKSWDVTFKWIGTQTRFNAGWIGMTRDLGLKIGDVCRFTLIKPNEMLVKVFRKVTP